MFLENEIILGKCAPFKAQLEEVLNKGFNNIELQLLKPATEDDYNTILSFSDLHIKGVHTPLNNEDKTATLENHHDLNGDIAIDLLSNKEHYDAFDSTCWLAQKLATYYNKRMYVVLHNSMSAFQYKKIPVLTNYLIEIFRDFTKKYPNIDFYIENTTPVTFLDNFRSGSYINDVAYIVNLLNKYYPGRFGITYDICHGLMTKNIHNAIHVNNEKLNVENYKERDFSYKTLFSNYGHLIKNIHLNNARGFGSTESTHSVGFYTKEDKKMLESILTEYIKNDCKAYLTLEISEIDYLNYQNGPKSRKMVEEVLNKLM